MENGQTKIWGNAWLHPCARVSEALETCSNQFGFKAKHSTDMCILAFKEAILKYRDLSSNVYTVEPLLYDHPQNHIGVVV